MPSRVLPSVAHIPPAVESSDINRLPANWHRCIEVKSRPTKRRMRKGISVSANDVFPDGKMIYFLRKCEILLTQYDICPKEHIVVSLRDDLTQKVLLQNLQQNFFLQYFRRKYITGEAYFTRRKTYITDLRCKSISLWGVHIPMRTPLKWGGPCDVITDLP